MLADLDPLAREKNIELSGNCENLTMEGSDILIYRLVYNLVENAIKYNQAGGQVTVTAAGKDRHIYLAVTDTGNGIPQELRERIFEPFSVWINPEAGLWAVWDLDLPWSVKL